MKRVLYHILNVMPPGRFLLAGVILLLCSECWSQNNTVLDTAHTWLSYKNIDLYSNLHLPDTFNIQLSATALRLANSGREREFPVSNIEGSWTDITQPGTVTFDVQVLDLAGKGRLQREGGQLSLVIDLSARPAWMKRKFIINQP